MASPIAEFATHFAPGERVAAEALSELSARVRGDHTLATVLESVCAYAIVIDGNRQILAANSALLALLGSPGLEAVLGKRPGEVVGCLNAERGPSGCGTSRQCRHCGGVIAILAAQKNDLPVEGECTIICPANGAAKTAAFRVRVSPIAFEGERIYLSVFHETGASRRHSVLDRVFLHDLSNLVGGLLGWTEQLQETTDTEAVTNIRQLAQEIREQLEDQRALAKMEQGALYLKPQAIDLDELAKGIQAWFGAHECSRGRTLRIQQVESENTLVTDLNLLNRVVGNLVKNALEACREGDSVLLRVHVGDERARFEIRNPGSISPDIAARLLKEPVSTKGFGRGLGLYSAQLFGELYLGGSLAFDSSEDRGTRFYFELPTKRTA